MEFLLFSLYFITLCNFGMAELDKQFLDASSQFSGELYQKTVEGKEGNVIISPISIQTAVSFAMFGASGGTETEMKNALKYGSTSKDKLMENFQQLTTSFENTNGLKVANKLYLMKNYAVQAKFNEIATKSFHSEAESVDFADNVAAAGNINQWVESKTNNKIKDLISSDSLDALTRLVLVNAIYFKGFWTHQFDPKRTYKGPFYLNDKDTVDVDYMTIKKHFKYGVFEELEATAIELPYKDSNITMMIILPDSKTGLSALESKLNTINLGELSSKMYSQEVNVEIPKFKIEFSVELNDPLKKMGMTRMFSDNAEFANLLDSPEALKVSKVVHKAFIEVNEEGAEAAAATGMIAMSFCLPITYDFKAEHPFYFAIVDEDQRTLFSGRMANLPQ